MTVLGIETATVTCSAAVVVDGRIVAEVTMHRPRAHAEMLLSQIDEVLVSSGVKQDRIEGIAVSIGPGSFTGLRIGLSVAKGLAWATGKPVAGVSTLKALARKTLSARAIGENGLLLTVLDCRKGEVYCRLDRVHKGMTHQEWDDRSMRIAELLREIPETPVVATGETGQLREEPGMSGEMTFLGGEAGRCSAGPVALEGEEYFLKGSGMDLPLLEPRYIHEFEPKVKLMERL
jgi:tRNA threonylcarbamoyladenosine biosynthesis protein TsaB